MRFRVIQSNSLAFIQSLGEFPDINDPRNTTSTWTLNLLIYCIIILITISTCLCVCQYLVCSLYVMVQIPGGCQGFVLVGNVTYQSGDDDDKVISQAGVTGCDVYGWVEPNQGANCIISSRGVIRLQLYASGYIKLFVKLKNTRTLNCNQQKS